MLKNHYSFVLGLCSYVVFIATTLIIVLWPTELNPIFDGVFWSTFAIFFESCFVVGYLYKTRGGSTRNVRFSFGILLIVAAAVMFSGLNRITENSATWKPRYPDNYAIFFIWLSTLIVYAKDIISIGIGALGANLIGYAITEPKKSKNKTFKRRSQFM
ncbi:hypothetical protein ACIDE9_00655 [Methylophilus sp. 'Pure River']|uniref:hypothetical protein n=1 Tax=Methylophilus sp. 'Pure River' TaxID=3377117 RepID=UPI00398F65E5